MRIGGGFDYEKYIFFCFVTQLKVNALNVIYISFCNDL